MAEQIDFQKSIHTQRGSGATHNFSRSRTRHIVPQEVGFICLPATRFVDRVDSPEAQQQLVPEIIPVSARFKCIKQ